METSYKVLHYVTTLVSKLKSSLPLTSIYNRLGFDFGTVGNHEFNYDLPYLKQAINQLHYPVLCANIIEKHSHSLAKVFIILK